MGIDELLKEKREAILALAERYGVSNVRVFGSMARGQARPDSDVDLLIHVPADAGWEWMGLWDDLEALLGREVDLIPEDCLRESLRESVYRDLVRL